MLSVYLIFLTLVSLGHGACPHGWITHDKSCYLFSHGKDTWADASLICNTIDSTLVEIDNILENGFVGNYTRGDFSWIAANDIVVENEWKWSLSNNDLNFTNWHSGEPNNLDGEENCAIINNTDGTWHDNPCSYLRYFICEKARAPEEATGQILG